ncbi:hypothetical protein E2320_021230 [Naja naja]|nr:hypothetical protein E2320_021230 [Naja naja]
MRRIRANAIAILTVAWILGTFYYLWQDSKPHSAASSRSPGSGGVGVKSGQRSSGKVELHKEERTVPLLGDLTLKMAVEESQVAEMSILSATEIQGSNSNATNKPSTAMHYDDSFPDESSEAQEDVNRLRGQPPHSERIGFLITNLCNRKQPA